ncbi:hypothetical protein ACFRMQ_00175 [Kitasatospora sp. NPDC056783]|uniref:hypothetical protein n=1 Tax=Kitasatospora sp. NPDC056783 TaxID=3345943 RepID=UPI0036C7EEA8
MTTELSPTLIAHLRKASADPQGSLPAGISRRGRGVLLEAGYAYAEDGDGYRLTPPDARERHDSALTITLEGRRAALTAPQLAALTTDVATDGGLSPRTRWQTVHSLRALHLVEARAPDGAASATTGPDGENGHAYRTRLGDAIATLPSP